MAAWVTDMFWDFYLVKDHKIANNSTTTNLKEFYKSFDAYFDKFHKYQILLNKISRIFLVSTHAN